MHAANGKKQINSQLQLQIGADPDQLPSERQVRVDNPTNMNPGLLQE